jgi:thiol-disulfide isomerase/thioredoxin
MATLVAGAVLAACGSGASPLSASATTASTSPPTSAATATTIPPTTTTVPPRPRRRKGGERRRAVSAAIYDGLATIPPAALAAAAHSLPTTGSYPTVVAHGPAVTADGKPVVLNIGAEWCPYCAAQNWSLVIALAQFGTFKDLTWVPSSAKVAEEYRSVPGFTFYRSDYSSNRLSLAALEIADVAEKPLQRPTAAEARLLSRYDSQEGIPFLYLDGTAYLEGSGTSPQLLGHSFTAAAHSIIGGTSTLARTVDGNAGILISYLCQITHGQPARVCRAFPKALAH